SAFGHQARIRDARRAWNATLDFLDQWTINRVEPYVKLDCNWPSESTDSEVVAKRIETARTLFGPERNAFNVSGTWELALENLPIAISFALDDDKWPKQVLGPTRLFFRYHFQWKEHPTESSSRLGIHLGGQRLFLQPALCFPLPHDSPELRSL